MAKDESRGNDEGRERKETPEERESRLLLNRFLTTADPVLERLLARLLREPQDSAAHRDLKYLYQIWNSARERLRAINLLIQNLLYVANGASGL